jgi:hypothetical protein
MIRSAKSISMIILGAAVDCFESLRDVFDQRVRRALVEEHAVLPASSPRLWQ